MNIWHLALVFVFIGVATPSAAQSAIDRYISYVREAQTLNNTIDFGPFVRPGKLAVLLEAPLRMDLSKFIVKNSAGMQLLKALEQWNALSLAYDDHDCVKAYQRGSVRQ